MNTIIINADDCGKSKGVNEAIAHCIDEGLITSTTVMANMDDFEGALDLYKKYSGKISFGLHLTFDEGEPIIKSDILEERGFYRKVENRLLMAVPNLKKPISRELSIALYEEIEAQLQKILNSGMIITHFDSHHHIHTSPFVLPIVMKLAKKYNIRNIRGIRNYYPFSLNKCMRDGWKLYAKILNKNCRMTDYFCSVSEFVKSDLEVKDSIIELMCHPGHPKDIFAEEIKMLKSFLANEGDSFNFSTYYY